MLPWLDTRLCTRLGRCLLEPAREEKRGLIMKPSVKLLHITHVLEKNYTTGQPGSAGHWEVVLGNGALTAIPGVTRTLHVIRDISVAAQLSTLGTGKQ